MTKIPQSILNIINQKHETDKSPLTCIVCGYYQPTGEGTGHCHRYPPTATGYPDVIDDTDWCGEHSEYNEDGE